MKSINIGTVSSIATTSTASEADELLDDINKKYGATHKHKICGTQNGVSCKRNTNNGVGHYLGGVHDDLNEEWYGIGGTIDATELQKRKYFYLTSDLVIGNSTGFDIDIEELCLCLNGKTLSVDFNTVPINRPCFSVAKELNICNCSGSTAKIIGDNHVMVETRAYFGGYNEDPVIIGIYGKYTTSRNQNIEIESKRSFIQALRLIRPLNLTGVGFRYIGVLEGVINNYSSTNRLDNNFLYCLASDERVQINVNIEWSVCVIPRIILSYVDKVGNLSFIKKSGNSTNVGEKWNLRFVDLDYTYPKVDGSDNNYPSHQKTVNDIVNNHYYQKVETASSVYHFENRIIDLAFARNEDIRVAFTASHDHKICGTEGNCSHLGPSHSKSVTWKEIYSESELMDKIAKNDGDYYCLEKDLTVSTFQLPRDIYICLNGYKFKTNSFTSSLEGRNIYITNCVASNTVGIYQIDGECSENQYLFSNVKSHVMGTKTINVSLIGKYLTSSTTSTTYKCSDDICNVKITRTVNDTASPIFNINNDSAIRTLNLENLNITNVSASNMIYVTKNTNSMNVNIKNVTIENSTTNEELIYLGGTADVKLNVYGSNNIKSNTAQNKYTSSAYSINDSFMRTKGITLDGSATLNIENNYSSGGGRFIYNENADIKANNANSTLSRNPLGSE